MKAAGCTAAELKAAGYQLADMKAAGFTAPELLYGNPYGRGHMTHLFSAAELKAAGFTCQELGSRAYRRFGGTGGFTSSELVAAGFPEVEALNADHAAVEQAAALVTTGAELKKYARAKLHARTVHVAVLKRFRVEKSTFYILALLHWNSFHESPLRITRAQLGRSMLGLNLSQCSFCIFLILNVHHTLSQGHRSSCKVQAFSLIRPTASAFTFKSIPNPRKGKAVLLPTKTACSTSLHPVEVKLRVGSVAYKPLLAFCETIPTNKNIIINKCQRKLPSTRASPPASVSASLAACTHWCMR